MRGTQKQAVAYHIEPVSAAIDPPDLFAHFATRTGLFFLDSGCRAPDTGRYSFLGFDPYSTLSFRQGVARVTNHHAVRNFATDPFELVIGGEHGPTAQESGPLPFLGGAVGYLSYDLGRYVEKIPTATFDDLLLPELRFGLYDCIIAIDHTNGLVQVVTSDPGGRDDLEARAKALASEIASIKPAPALPELRESPAATVESNFTQEEYQQMVSEVIEHIAAGDIFQANLAQRFSFPMPESPALIYRRLRNASPGDFAAYLDAGDFQILSSSPERYLMRQGNRVETRPIKGTRPRLTGDADDAIRRELFESEKDNAELAMIIDLERNDLGRVCEFGTVEVAEAKRLDSYATVHHLSAIVRGKLKPGCTTGALLRATFPGGSITGAPKVRAMEIIEELEPIRRGVYTGAIGYIGFDGNLDLNIAIRTVVAKEGTGHYWAGGGIVYDSDPQDEYNETLAKAQGVMNGLRIGRD